MSEVGPEVDRDRYEVASDLRVISTRIARRIRSERVDQLPQHLYAVLVQLEAGPLGVRELADRDRVASPVMTRNVNELADAGYVERTPHPDDGRRVTVSLTEAGRAAIDKVRLNRDQWMAARVATVSESEFDVLRRAVQVLRKLDEW